MQYTEEDVIQIVYIVRNDFGEYLRGSDARKRFLWSPRPSEAGIFRKKTHAIACLKQRKIKNAHIIPYELKEKKD